MAKLKFSNGGNLPNFKNVSHDKLIRAINSALRRTLKGARKDAANKTRERFTIANRAVTKTLKVKVWNLRGEMTSNGKNNPLEKFKLKPKRRLKKPPVSGVFSEPIRGQGHYWRKGFLSRAGKVLTRVGKSRYPIKGLVAHSAPEMLNFPPVSSFLIKKIEERLNINLAHELNAAVAGFF